MNGQDEVRAIQKSLEPWIRKIVADATRSCVRRKTVTVATAPNGATMGVKEPYDDTVMDVPYVSTMSGAAVGDTVTIEWMYGLSNAWVVTREGSGGGGGGVTPNIQATAETLPAGSEATVTRTGSNANPVFNFGIPKGDQGDPGADATINGVNTLTIQEGANISLSQSGATLTISATGGGSMEDAVTVPGGGVVDLPDSFGTGPYTFEMTEETGGGGTSGVSSFNGRTGAVIPQTDDYTAAMVGAIASADIASAVVLTKAEWTALTTKKPAVLYFVKEDGNG